MKDSHAESRVAVRVERTEGDFPHVRRPGVWLACCTTTSCCLVFLLGAGGGLIGLVTGIVKGTMLHRTTDSMISDIALSFCRVVLLALALGIQGVLIGAAIGFVLDKMLGMP